MKILPSVSEKKVPSEMVAAFFFAVLMPSFPAYQAVRLWHIY